MWIDVRGEFSRRNNAQRLGLEPQMLNAVAEILITARLSPRFTSAVTSQHAARGEQRAAARVNGGCSARLGYANIEASARASHAFRKAQPFRRNAAFDNVASEATNSPFAPPAICL